MKKAAFIGTGNMGSALARAVCRAVGPEEVILSNRTLDKAASLAGELGCTAATDNGEAVTAARCLFLCVKPAGFADLARELKPHLRACREAGQEKILISVAAGLTLDRLEQLFSGMGCPILRVMPNTCVAVGKGAAAICTHPETDRKILAEVSRMLSAAGLVEQIPEELMDAFTSVAGCGPAFVYPYIEALADGGVMAGLPREQALRCAAQTVLGAASMVLETGAHPGLLKDQVCSPGGSTIAGVAALERAGLRAAAIDAVLASLERNRELGKASD